MARNNQSKRRLRGPALLLAAAFPFLLSGCGEAPAPPQSSGGTGSTAAPAAASSSLNGEPAVPQSFPPASFPAASPTGKAVEQNGAMLDTGGAQRGYLLASYSGSTEKRAKLAVVKGEDTYYYDLLYGEAKAFPFSLGDGEYTVTVYEQKEGTTYTPLLSQTVAVALEDAFSPFLLPSQYVSFDADSASTKKAYELSAGCRSDVEVLSNIYAYVKTHISYDTGKAELYRDKPIFTPDPDETLSTGKGICFDYAALTAAMLRANGIPTKLITGYVAPNDIYHAWNLVYLKNSGWVEVKFAAQGDEWNRVDLTFAAGMSDSALSAFVGDGTHYTDRFVY